MRRSFGGSWTPYMSGSFRSCAVAAAAIVLVFLLQRLPAHARDDEAKPLAFTIVAAGKDCPGCVVINARGEVTDDSSRDFALFVAEGRLKGILPKEPRRGATRDVNAPRVIVAFESIGGKVVPGLVIGRRIRRLGWTTIVGQGRLTEKGVLFEPAGCYSACSMMMLGGVERFVAPGSKPGVHQFSPQFKDEETFSASDMNAIVRDYARQVVGVYDYVQEMGVDIGFFIATLRTPFNSMDVLSQDRWIKLGLATNLLPDGDETPIVAVLDAGRAKEAFPLPKVAHADTAELPVDAQPVAASSSAPASDGAWIVRRGEGGSLDARFSDNSISLSLACVRPDAAKLELIFKALDPINLEHIRAAAFATKRLGLGGREIAIAAVAAPGRGEQGVEALLDTRDLKALQDADALTVAVLDRSGRPAAHVASVSGAGAAKAISDAMARCGGV
jgi:hypothetical protein